MEAAAAAALTRQVEELDALAAVFAAEGEFEAAWDDVRMLRSALEQGAAVTGSLLPLRCSVRVVVEDSPPAAALCFELPREYPARPPGIELSRVDPLLTRSDIQHVVASLKASAAVSAADGGG